MKIQFFGATQEVTGSCYLISIGGLNILVECGLVQGSHSHERNNYADFPFDIEQIDAVILTHAHLDHSGKIPLLHKRGYRGPVYSHNATVELCSILFQDAGYLNERAAFRENKYRQRNGQKAVEPLYTKSDAILAQSLLQGLQYQQPQKILPGVELTLYDAGHILGSAIVELKLTENRKTKRIVFSGDLGHKDAPILKNPTIIEQADLVVMASGTATLEAMLLRKPMVVCYRLAPITYMIASRIVDVPHMALPNLLAGERLVPEYVQNEVTVAVIRDEILQFFANPGAVADRLEIFERLHHELRKDASAAAAAAIKDLVDSQG